MKLNFLKSTIYFQAKQTLLIMKGTLEAEQFYFGHQQTFFFDTRYSFCTTRYKAYAEKNNENADKRNYISFIVFL